MRLKGRHRIGGVTTVEHVEDVITVVKLITEDSLDFHSRHYPCHNAECFNHRRKIRSSALPNKKMMTR